MRKYLWWIENKKGSSQGEWNSKTEAEKEIKNNIRLGFFSKDSGWKPVRYETELCPTCGRPAPRVIIDGLGECLKCDHVRGDL